MSTPRERPILFSGQMVRAILDGRKTQTRRVVKDHGKAGVAVMQNGCGVLWDSCPYGQPGDLLWVRETFQLHTTGAGIRVTYREGNEDRWVEPPETWPGISDDNHWRPSIFMPRWASRITLEIEAVRVERVQDISEEDARAEGIVIWEVDRLQRGDRGGRSDFRELWDSINAELGFGWDTNPFVWVIQFKRVNP